MFNCGVVVCGFQHIRLRNPVLHVVIATICVYCVSPVVWFYKMYFVKFVKAMK